MKKLTLLMCALAVVSGAYAGTPSRVVKDINALPQTERGQRAARVHSVTRVKHFEGVAQQPNKAKAPKALQGTYTVNVGNVDWEYDSYYGEVQYKIFNADSSKVFKFDIILAEGLSDVESGKTYTFDDMSQWYSYWENPNSPLEYGDFTDATFTKTVAADGSYTLVATATDSNGDTYNINYAGQPYVPQVINVTIGSIASSYYAETKEAYYQLLDMDNQYAFYFDIYVAEDLTDVESGKTYTLADMSDWNSYGYRYVDFSTISFASASFMKTLAADGSFTIAASVTTPKGDTYNLSYSQGAPTVREETLTLDGTFMQNDYMWMLAAADEDTTTYVSLVVYEAFEEGTYTEKELDGYYTFIATYGADTTYYNLVNASITVTAKDSVYTATGTMLTANEKEPTDQVLFTLTLTAKEEEVSQGGDDSMYPKETDEDLVQTFASYDINDMYIEEYGSVYIESLNEDNYYIVLDVTLPEGATELAAGEYNIDDTYGYQTVYSGFYSSLYGEVVPSLAAKLTEEDGELYYDDIWWIVSGTVTIDEDKTVTVNAYNSLGRSVKAVLYYAPAQEGLSSVDASASTSKRLVNGTIVIEKNGVRYSVLGTTVQ